MSLRARFLGLIDVVLRIPPLFLLDEILKMNLFFENSSSQENVENSILNDTLGNEIASNQTESYTASIDFYGLSWIFFRFILFLLGCFSSLAIFMLWTRHLVIIYMYVVSVGLIFLSYWSNVAAIALLQEGSSSLIEDILNVMCRNLHHPMVLPLRFYRTSFYSTS